MGCPVLFAKLFYNPKLHLCVNFVKGNSSSTFFREKIRIPMCTMYTKVIIEKSRGERCVMEQDTIENVTLPRSGSEWPFDQA